MLNRSHPSASSQRGVGALVVVMVLFFIMSMVAAYASRNLIFEQKTSANNYRANQAFEAAEAGLEWAIAMLNGGRVDNACAGTNDVATDTFRARHLSTDVNDAVDIRKWVNAGVDADLLPSCVRGDAGWVCSCPGASGPVIPAPAATGPAPGFQITFFRVGVVAGRPVVRVRSQSCSTVGAGCFDPLGRRSDALAELNVLVGLTPSLTQAPAAALTTRGALTANSARIASADGVVINAGGDIVAPLASGPAGSPPLLVKNDPSLSNIAGAGGMTAGEMMFLATFGMDPKTYRTQPAVVRIACGVECSAALQDAAQRHPGQVIWIDGNLNIDGPLLMGSVAAPAIVVVGGNTNLGAASNVTINGLVYSRGDTWTQPAGSALIRGAFIAEGPLTIDGAPSIVFDNAVVDHLKKVEARKVLEFGSFVRVPGSWRDF